MCRPKQRTEPEGTGIRLTGTVTVGGRPAGGAYVQIRNLAGDFQGEVRTEADGRFVLYPVSGRWRLVSWVPGIGRTEQEVEIGESDAEVELSLGRE